MSSLRKYVSYMKKCLGCFFINIDFHYRGTICFYYYYEFHPRWFLLLLHVNGVVVACSSSPRINRSYGADALSLLQTPPVRRRTPASKGLSSSLKQPEFVPQSIIKTMPSAMKRVNMAASVNDGGRSGVTWPAMPGQWWAVVGCFRSLL